MASVDQSHSSVDKASVESILSSGQDGGSSAQAPPAEHIGPQSNTQFNRASFPITRTPSSRSSAARPLSYAARNGKRLSLNFPIQPSSYMNMDPNISSDSATPSAPSTPSLDQAAPSPADPSGYLVALATQERRVLELKEELSRAESNLAKLKRQWTMHEATRKRAEIMHVSQMQPVPTDHSSSETAEDENIGSLRISAEMERRKALLERVSKDSRRRVMSGGHTRTLSLLSPDRMGNIGLGSPPLTANSQLHQYSSPSSPMPRRETMPDSSTGLSKQYSAYSRHPYQNGGSNDVLRTGKKMAEDFKTGLWTFMEDLRQATVGDEDYPVRESPDTHNSALRNKSNKGKLLDTRKCPGVGSRKTSSTRTRTLSEKSKTSVPDPNLLDSLDDDWSNWDTPPLAESPRWSSSTIVSNGHSAGDTESNIEPRYVLN